MDYIAALGIPEVLESLQRDYGESWHKGKLEETLKNDPRLKTILKLRDLTKIRTNQQRKTTAGVPKKRVRKAGKLIGLKKLRVDRNLTQPELSKVLTNRYSVEISPNSISQYECGRVHASKATIKVMADYFGLTEAQMRRELEKNRIDYLNRKIKEQGA